MQTLSGASIAKTVEGAEQALAMGPAASQIAIKQLGTNGGGFFNVNSAYPFENANALTNFVELLSIILIPTALTYTYGKMVGRQRQGWAIFAAMLAIYLAFVVVIIPAEQHGTPRQHAAGTRLRRSMALRAATWKARSSATGSPSRRCGRTTTTVTSNGSVNSALDSYTGLGGAVPMSSLAPARWSSAASAPACTAMLLYVLLAVFIGGLMVGRTPEYLGKKIQASEIKLISLGILVTPLAVLIDDRRWRSQRVQACLRSISAGPQGFSESLYAYLSQANNNGSAFAGYTGFLQPNAPGNHGAYGISFADLLGGATMTLARFLPIIFVLAVAGSLAGKKVSPAGPGTMRTDTPTFVILLVGVIVVGALTFFPALLLGPIVQSLTTSCSEMRRDGPYFDSRRDRLHADLRPRLPAGDDRHLPGVFPGRQTARGDGERTAGRFQLIGQSFSRPVIGKDGKPNG